MYIIYVNTYWDISTMIKRNVDVEKCKIYETYNFGDKKRHWQVWRRLKNKATLFHFTDSGSNLSNCNDLFVNLVSDSNVESDPDSQHKHTALSRGHIWLTLFLHIFVPYVISGNHGENLGQQLCICLIHRLW